jgi:hypothetical protein
LQILLSFIIAMRQDKAATRFPDHDLPDRKTSSRRSFENSPNGIPHVPQAERDDLAGATAAATQKRQMRSAKGAGALSIVAWGTDRGIRSHRK